MKRIVLTALAWAGLLAGVAAQAGEITLFARDGFRGQEVTIREGVRNLRDAGFNDRASSLVVHSGTWEICEHKDFGGYCAVFERGQYSSLRGFNNNISSAREIERARGGHRDRDRDGVDDRVEREQRRDDWRDGRNDNRNDGRQNGQAGGDWRDGNRGGEALTLFEHDRFGGRAVSFQGDARSMRGVDFNDRASSLVIHQGQWQLCEDDNFGGRCVVYGPGRYDNVGNMNDRISSLRRIR